MSKYDWQKKGLIILGVNHEFEQEQILAFFHSGFQSERVISDFTQTERGGSMHTDVIHEKWGGGKQKIKSLIIIVARKIEFFRGIDASSVFGFDLRIIKSTSFSPSKSSFQIQINTACTGDRLKKSLGIYMV